MFLGYNLKGSWWDLSIDTSWPAKVAIVGQTGAVSQLIISSLRFCSINSGKYLVEWQSIYSYETSLRLTVWHGTPESHEATRNFIHDLICAFENPWRQSGRLLPRKQPMQTFYPAVTTGDTILNWKMQENLIGLEASSWPSLGLSGHPLTYL